MDNPKPIRIPGGRFDHFNLFKIDVMGDGSCWFHAFCMAYFLPYRTQRYNGKVYRRRDIVQTLRKELSEKLSQPVNPDDPKGPTVYQSLGGGTLEELGKENKEFSLSGMISHINSNAPCGEEIQELTSEQTNKNIFYIDTNSGDVYIVSNVELLYKNRPSVVLLYNGGHYDTCALRESNGNLVTHFAFEHSFIQFLYKRLLELTSEGK